MRVVRERNLMRSQEMLSKNDFDSVKDSFDTPGVSWSPSGLNADCGDLDTHCFDIYTTMVPVHACTSPSRQRHMATKQSIKSEGDHCCQ
jgi:hypothetical protein